MSKQETNDVMASYHRCRADERFVDTFYDLFLADSPEIAKKFAHTDFRHQKLMLRESLLELLLYDQGQAGAHDDIAKLAKRHKELEIKPEMYATWLDALCAAIKTHDPEYTAQIGDNWRQAMRKGIEAMLS